MFCPGCGAVVRDDLQYCPNCRAQLTNYNTSYNDGGNYYSQVQANNGRTGEYKQHYNDMSYAQQNTAPQLDKNKLAIIIAVILLAAIIIVIGAVLLLRGGGDAYDSEYTLNTHSLIRINEIDEGESCNVEIESMKKDKNGNEYSGTFVLTRKEPMAVVDLVESEYSVTITYRATVVVHKVTIKETCTQDSVTLYASDLNKNPVIKNEDIHSITAVSKPVTVVTTMGPIIPREPTTQQSYGTPSLKQKTNTTKKRTTTAATTTESASSKIVYNTTYYDITEYEFGLDYLDSSSKISFNENGSFVFDYLADWEGERMRYDGFYYTEGDRIICIPETYHFTGHDIDENNNFVPYEESGRIEELDNYNSSSNKIVFEITSRGSLVLERQFDSYNVGHVYEVR